MGNFYDEELLVPRPTSKLEHHSLSAVRDRISSIFAVILYIGGCSSISNLRTPHAVVAGTHLYTSIYTPIAKNWKYILSRMIKAASVTQVSSV
jgi:hypothetical protein